MKTMTRDALMLTAVSFSLLFAAPLTVFAAGPAPINLLSAGNFVILAKSGVSTTGSTVIVGDIGVSPAAATYLTGFALSLTSGSSFATSAQVSGKLYAPGYAAPTPDVLNTAISDMESAYTNAVGRTNPSATELGAGNIGGLTIAPGLYKWSTGVTIPTDVTLSGSANDVWIFQIAQTLTVSSNVNILLAGGAQASNIFWAVAGQTTVGTGAVINGTILDQTAIVFATGAKLNGRALAQTAITFDSNMVTGTSVSVPVSTPTPVQPLVPIQVNTPSPAVEAPYVPASSHDFTNTPASPAYMPVSAPGQLIRNIAIDLRQGVRNTSVVTLQQFLISQNTGARSQALAAVGATGYFGALTRSALAEFQARVGISPALGNFGSITRAYMSVHY